MPRPFLTTSILVLFLFAAGRGLATETAPGDAGISAVESGELFLPSEDALADVARTFEMARKRNQRVLVVLGANWCHDSRALAARLHKEPLEAVITRHYQLVFVDVGYLERGRDVINSLGVPVYYATPTVLILDPVSGSLVNAENRHQWGNANSISMEDSLEYFQLMADAETSVELSNNPAAVELQELLAEIDTFELEQAERLYAAYAVIGPLLKEYKDIKEPEPFESYWNEVRQFRMKVPHDVSQLRKTAREKVSAGESEIQLHYPTYPAFSWEAEQPWTQP